MPGSWAPHDLPNLTDANCIETSKRSNAYNCIAWAAADTHRWWWPIRRPGVTYWPKNVPREETVEAFILAYGTLGFTLCGDGSLQSDIEKIALFARVARGILIPTHASRQLESGEWTSKLGPFEDVAHSTLDAVNSPIYGQAICFLARPRPSSSASPL